MERGRTEQPVARHAAGRVRSIWPGILRMLLVGVAVLAVSVAGVTGYAAWRISQEVGGGVVQIGSTPPPPQALDGAFTVLLVGADNAPGQAGFGESRQASLNDVNIIVHIAADHRSGTVISIPRDLVIPHPACTDPRTKRTYPAMSAQPINEAFERGGLACVVTTVHALTGIDIPYAAQFTFAGTVKMADAVGGVPVCVTKAIDDPKSGLRLKKGTSIIKGRTALAYLRDRKAIGDRSDLARIQSQQAYMSSLLRTMTSSDTFSNPVRLYGLASAAAQNVSLSSSLADTGTMVRMAVALKSLDLSHLVFVQYPTAQDPANHDKVIPDAAIAATLTSRVRHDEPIALDKDALGPAVVDSGPTPGPTSTSTPAPSRTDAATIAGLKGRTAAQRTCSVTTRPHG
jgi:LCP family protein required for cell wall assembly